MVALADSQMLTTERERLVAAITHDATEVARIGHDYSADWADAVRRIVRASDQLEICNRQLRDAEDQD